MSIYRVPLKDLDVDSFQLPVTCSGYSLLFEFSWDSIAQRQYDNIALSLAALQKSNPLVLVSNLKNIVDNTDFSAYITNWDTLLNTFIVYKGGRINELIYSPGEIDWAQFLIDMNLYLDSFSSQYISFNHISKLQEFLAYLQEIISAVTIEDVPGTLNLLQNMPDSLASYITQYLAYTAEVANQKADLEELLYWTVALHFGEASATSALEIGGTQFDQFVGFPKVVFQSPLSKIGRRDMASVTLWIGIADGSE